MGSIKRNWLLVGMFAFVLMFGCFFGLGIDNQVQIALAETEITSASTSWSGEMACDEDVTISSSVSVTGNTVLTIALGKTLTLEDGLTINNNRTLTISGPGTLNISKADTGSSTGALYINNHGNLILNGGRIIVNATGTSQYAVYTYKTNEMASDTVSTTITVNDGAFIVNGGTQAGIRADVIDMNRGLLRVRPTGTDDTETYGILIKSITIGEIDDILYRPTVDVYEPSNNGCGISRYNQQNGTFEYYCGFFECQAATKAVNCNRTTEYSFVEYTGESKENATNTNLEDPYVFITHHIRDVAHEVSHSGDYLFTMSDGRKSDTLIVTADGDVGACEGRASVNDEITALDQFIKDFYCPMAEGDYGLIKDIVITGGDGKLTAADHGFVVNGIYKGWATVNGKYTYFNGVDYTEVPFEFQLKVCNEVTSDIDKMVYGGRLICEDDITLTNSEVFFGTTLYISAGKTLTFNHGLNIYYLCNFTVMGPGKLVISSFSESSYSGALVIEEDASLTINDGCVSVSLTDDSPYCVFGDENSTITINDGALVVDGGTKAGIYANVIDVNRGLLRVNSIGTDDSPSYGLFMNSLSVGIENDYTHRPTLEVVASSENSVGITNPNPGSSGNFIYYCGFVEVTATTQAFDCFSENVNDGIVYSGDIKATASTSGASLNDKYVLINHDKSVLTKTTDYDFLFTLNSDGKEDSIYLTPTSLTLPFEGRSSENVVLTDLDQFVKDFFYPVLNGGPYGTVKDIEITGGNGQVVGTTNGFAVNGKFNGPATISGKYTYFDGTEYLDIPFEIDVVVSGGPDLTYEAHGDTLTATYGTFGSYDLTIVAPTENLAYDGNAKVATLEAGYNVYMFPNAVIKYFKGADEVDTCIEQGEYTAKVSFGGESAEVSFVVSASNQNNNHGFCLGWISFIVSAFVFLWLVMNLCLRLYKYKGFRIFGALLALAGLASAIVIVAIHFCAISIVSIIVASGTLLGFVLSWSLSREMNK